MEGDTGEGCEKCIDVTERTNSYRLFCFFPYLIPTAPCFVLKWSSVTPTELSLVELL